MSFTFLNPVHLLFSANPKRCRAKHDLERSYGQPVRGRAVHPPMLLPKRGKLSSGRRSLILPVKSLPKIILFLLLVVLTPFLVSAETSPQTFTITHRGTTVEYTVSGLGNLTLHNTDFAGTYYAVTDCKDMGRIGTASITARLVATDGLLYYKPGVYGVEQYIRIFWHFNDPPVGSNLELQVGDQLSATGTYSFEDYSSDFAVAEGYSYINLSWSPSVGYGLGVEFIVPIDTCRNNLSMNKDKLGGPDDNSYTEFDGL